MKKLDNNAFFGNTGHFDSGHVDNDIGLAGSKGLERRKSTTLCQIFPVGHRVFVLASGRLRNFYLRGHPSFKMSYSFTDQVLAQLEEFDDVPHEVWSPCGKVTRGIHLRARR